MSIQSIIQGIPVNGDDTDKVNYLFDPKTITKGQALQDRELPIIEVELKKHYQGGKVRQWISLIKKNKNKAPKSSS